jgi:hypothetical protein
LCRYGNLLTYSDPTLPNSPMAMRYRRSVRLRWAPARRRAGSRRGVGRFSARVLSRRNRSPRAIRGCRSGTLPANCWGTRALARKRLPRYCCQRQMYIRPNDGFCPNDRRDLRHSATGGARVKIPRHLSRAGGEDSETTGRATTRCAVELGLVRVPHRRSIRHGVHAACDHALRF